MSNKKLKIAVVGLRFGGEFPPIYRDHPDVESVTLCELNRDMLSEYARKFGFKNTCDNFDALCDSDVDAIHIVTGIPNHAELVIKALNSGKHVACTVPMATTIEDMYRIIEAQRASQKNYMMMETSIYTFQCLYVKSLIEEGKLGRIQYLRGTHFQDMEAWPDYWMGLPPFWYATHAVAPLLHLSDSWATRVMCLGSGVMRDELKERYGNPFPIEHAMMELNKPDLKAEITRSLFHTAIGYVEGFTVLGEKMSFEWDIEEEPPYIHTIKVKDGESVINSYGRGRDIAISRVTCPDRGDLLPESIRAYTRQHTILDPDNPHLSIKQGGGHHGSHPHMINEFVRSIIERRKPVVDEIAAARWTAVGVCSHISAMNNGKVIDVPSFD
ncbi:MAG: Gfo/Idh/MocA family oxidoreductase [Clostridia bacterium]|nr:Gfo/Idh/MocA family oxidoreductase [Clostridia bacterium]